MVISTGAETEAIYLRSSATNRYRAVQIDRSDRPTSSMKERGAKIDAARIYCIAMNDP